MQSFWEYASLIWIAITVMLCVLGAGYWLVRGWQQVPTHLKEGNGRGLWLWLCNGLGKQVWVLLPWRWRHKLPHWLGIEQQSSIFLLLGQVLGQTIVVMLVAALLSGWYSEQGINGYVVVSAGGLAMVLPWWVRYQERQRRVHAQRCHYPFFLDVLALSVESGAGVMLALQTAAESLPDGDLQRLLQQALFRMRSGMNREQSFERLVQDSGLVEIAVLSANLDNAVKMGLSLSTVLRAQADQYRQERFLRAEKKALEAPVKMLFPVVSCILPCTFLVIAFPLVMQIAESLFE